LLGITQSGFEGVRFSFEGVRVGFEGCGQMPVLWSPRSPTLARDMTAGFGKARADIDQVKDDVTVIKEHLAGSAN
jgi:hypothetical protein